MKISDNSPPTELDAPAPDEITGASWGSVVTLGPVSTADDLLALPDGWDAAQTPRQRGIVGVVRGGATLKPPT